MVPESFSSVVWRLFVGGRHSISRSSSNLAGQGEPAARNDGYPMFLLVNLCGLPEKPVVLVLPLADDCCYLGHIRFLDHFHSVREVLGYPWQA